MARNGITVNCVCPGPTNTALLAQTGDDRTTGLRAALAKAIPLGREGEPDDVAGVVAFLVTDDAAYMTGQTLSVNGGLTMCVRLVGRRRHSLVGPVKFGSRLSRTAAIPSTASGPPNP